MSVHLRVVCDECGTVHDTRHVTRWMARMAAESGGWLAGRDERDLCPDCVTVERDEQHEESTR